MFLEIAARDEPRRSWALNTGGLCAMNLGRAAEAESLLVAAAENNLFDRIVSPVPNYDPTNLLLGDRPAVGRREQPLATERDRRANARAGEWPSSACRFAR